MDVKPLQDRVMVKKADAVDKTASGIILAGEAKEKPVWAEVIAVGPGTDMVRVEVYPGDKVLCSKYGGTEIKVDGVDYTIYESKDILAVVED